MARRTPPQAELKPVYVRPQIDRHGRAAQRAWCSAAYRGERYRPKPGDFDPLWLRRGMRANLIESRAGWVVSNPLYDQILRRRPDTDPSLPGPGWLREVYRWRYHDLVTLPGVQAAIEARLATLREVEHRTAAGPAEVCHAAPAPGQAAADMEQLALFA